MKLHRNCKIETCVSTDASRFVIQLPHLTGSNLIATDGKKLVSLPVELSPSDVDGYISIDALKAARKGINKSQAEISAEADKLTLPMVLASPIFPRPTQDSGAYPKVQTIVDDARKGAKPTVCINARFLWEIAQALGCENVILEMHPKTNEIGIRAEKPLVIKAGPIRPFDEFRGPVGSPDGFGILMPVNANL